MDKISIKIPATSANLGLGFDSMGLAISKYLYLDASLSSKWQFEYKQDDLAQLPSGEMNLVAKTAKAIAQRFNKEMPALKVIMTSEIPLTHGLGSSSSAIVGGIELAKHFLDLNLTEEDKVRLASEIEGHPDNVGPCVTGGAFVGYYDQDLLVYHQIDFDGVSLILSIPPYEISTQDAREAIPDVYEKDKAVEQNAMNNVMLLSMIKGDYPTMGQLMMRDQFHEPYRQPLIKEFQDIKDTAISQGAYATLISGAGPTVLTLCSSDKVSEIIEKLKEVVPNCIHEETQVHYNS
ncbi:homoserine kinase [Aerococcaceae bacterium WGS1372]